MAARHPRDRRRRVRARLNALRSGCRQLKPRLAVWRWLLPAHARPRIANALLQKRRAVSRKMRAAVRCVKRPNANARSTPILWSKRRLPKQRPQPLPQLQKLPRPYRLQALTLRLQLKLRLPKRRRPLFP